MDIFLKQDFVPHCKQRAFLNSEHTQEVGDKNQVKKYSCTSCSEAKTDPLKHNVGRSRSSTMTSQSGNGEGASQGSFSNKINVPDRKQVTNKLSQIQSYVRQTAALMNTLKASDSDSDRKLSGLLNRMDNYELRLTMRLNSLLLDAELKDTVESNEAELARRSRESRKKLELLQKRKQDLLKLQEKAKKQLQEAQEEQSRLVARASSLNQELNANKIMDLNVQQLSQRLKTVQEFYNTRSQINDDLSENQRTNKVKVKQLEELSTEISDTETDFQLVADKMEELDAMKAQLGQIQKIMASINAIQNSEHAPQVSESGDDSREVNHSSQNSSFTEGMQTGEDGNDNLMKLEQTKSKLNHLTHLLEIVQSAQNTSGLSPAYLQLVSNLVNEETNSCAESPSPTSSVKSPQRNGDEFSVRTIKVMVKELEVTMAAMKEERDRLLAARQELQDIAKNLPPNKSEIEVTPDCDSESEPLCLKPAILDSFTRDNLNELTEVEQSSNCNESNPYIIRSSQNQNKQRRIWNSSSPNSTSQDRRSKNESFSRNSNQSFRGSSRAQGKDHPHWCSSPSVSCCNERPNAVTESQQQLEMSGNLCEMMLSESLQRGVQLNDISLQEMFSQHQLLTRTVAQCSQLLWLQQKQIIELRNAFMLQFGSFPSQQLHGQSIALNQPHLNVPVLANPFLMTPSLSNTRQMPPISIQQHQNFLHPLHQNVKLNAGEMHNIQASQQDLPEQYFPHGNQDSLHFPDGFGCDIRSGNFNRFNPPGSNANHSFHQNLSSGFNNRGPNGINSIVSEDSGALNNQVPPGNRANNYWDNFRSYSRQNLLSNTKSNEDSEQSRRYLVITSQDRQSRDLAPSLSLHNNQSTAGSSSQPIFSHGNCESVSNDRFLLPPSQNTRAGHHSQVVRLCAMETQHQRNPGKNESKHLDYESRNLITSAKNESAGGGRSRNPDPGADIKSVRNDVSLSFRNTDNLNSSRNFIQFVRDVDNEEAVHGNNKKRLEKSRYRNDGLGNLNNRGYQNTSLWESVYSEVSNFIRANESRPHFLLQLFRDLQQVTTDSLRQRILVNFQEIVTANNLSERTSNMSGGNVNIIENRNNIRENRSNLNRNQFEDPTRIDELFCHLRENQNTIRQNIGISSYLLGGNLENPNISNIRDLTSSRNNLENEGLRDLRTYFEANLCNFGHNSTLENPNLSNIRENLTRRIPRISDLENVQPKNVYQSIYDNVAELRRRNQEMTGSEYSSLFMNFEPENNYLDNEISGNCENVRMTNGDFELENNFEGAVGGRIHMQQESRPISSGFPVLDARDTFGHSRQFLGSGNDSGIDINYNNDERKRGFAEGDNASEGTVKAKNGDDSVENGVVLALRDEWDRKGRRDASFDSSSNQSRKDVTSPFMSICDNSFFHCRTYQQSDNGDLAEADQSRNEETSGAESDSGFINAQIVDPEVLFDADQNHQFLEENLSSQNIPEAERNFMGSKTCESECDVVSLRVADPEASFSNSSKPEGNFARANDSRNALRKFDISEEFKFSVNPSASSESALPKSGDKHWKKIEETSKREISGDIKKSSSKNSANKFRDSSFSLEKCSGAASEDVEDRKTDSDSTGSAVEGRQPFFPSESSDSAYHGAFQLAVEKSTEKENTSPEAESDWECGSG